MSATLVIALIAVSLLVIAAVLLGPASSDDSPSITLAGRLIALVAIVALVIAAVRAGATP